MNVVITGTSRGIGLELTRIALNQGDQVFAVARDPAKSSGLSQLKKDFAKTLTTYAADVRAENAANSIASALSSWPQVDVLINNAGIFKKGESGDDFLESFRVNSVAPFLVSRALLAKLRKSSKPKLVQVSSLMGSITDNGSGGSYAYRASKSALNMINKCLAVENDWLTAIVIHPGWVQTDMGGEAAPVALEDSASGIWRVIKGINAADSGKFFDFRGNNLPW